ncbi:unnamed protein product [Allacma fusca]|uniref:Transmembrane protein 18 n=1 Tax=Allacma fusca TaxID=39272 RepID=A0A8J2ME76_9HEXA|nr:unnamed protein product [Allacma fusca]
MHGHKLLEVCEGRLQETEGLVMDPSAEFLKINISQVLTQNFQQFNQFLIFFQTIEWSEPWLMALVCFHVFITLLTLLSRKRPTIQAVLFFFLLILIFLSEQLNTLAAENWMYYSKQQYFDSNGMFISLMFSAPLLFNCMLMVANWLLISSELMTSLRRFQLQQQSNRLRKLEKCVKGPSQSSSNISSGSVKRKSKERVRKD